MKWFILIVVIVSFVYSVSSVIYISNERKRSDLEVRVLVFEYGWICGRHFDTSWKSDSTEFYNNHIKNKLK